MRLLELGLRRFGPFTDLSLDFSAKAPAVHIVFGSNATGKSTSLRAITGLLYGIPQQTRDAHLHRMPELRIFGRVETPDLEVLSFVRRKGRKRTLVDPDDDKTAIDDAKLSRALRGVGEDLFRTMFGLDRDSLQRSGRALIAGEGLLGETLFDAGVGGRGIHATLHRLKQEADDLFTPRGTSKPLNAALRAVSEAKKRIDDASLSAVAWMKQREAIERDRAERDALRARREELKASQNRLSRAITVLPMLARRAERIAERTVLGDVTILAEDARERRLGAVRASDESTREAKRLKDELAKATARREALDIPESLARVDEDDIREIRDGLGNHRKAARDLPRRVGTLRAKEDEAETILRDLGSPAALDEVERLRIGTAERARIEYLATRESGLVVARDRDRAQLADSRAEREHLVLKRETLPSRRDTLALRGAIARARGLGPIDDDIERALSELRAARAQADRRLASLDRWQGSLEELVACPAPSLETVEHFSALWSRHQDDLRSLDRRRAELDEESRRLVGRIEEMNRAGAVPTEEDLEAVRAKRAEAWRAARRRLERGSAGDAEGAEVTAYVELVEAADGVADRLRREADRVATLARLEAERRGVAERQRALDAERAEVERKGDETRFRWEDAWASSKVTPPTPPEMVGWARSRAELVECADSLDRFAGEADRLRARRGEHRAELVSEIEALGELDLAGSAEEASFAAVVDLAEDLVETVGEQDRARDELDRAIASRDEEIDRLERRVRDQEAAYADFRSDWSESIRTIGLPPDATVEEAKAVLAGLTSLFGKTNEIEDMRRRVAGMERDAEHFEAEVRRLVAEHVPELKELPVDGAAEELVRRWSDAQHDVQKRAQIDDDQNEKRRALAKAEIAQARAGEVLAELVREARVEGVDRLEEAERLSDEARRLDRHVAELEAEIFRVGENTIDHLIAETEGVDVDSAKARAQEIEEEIGDINDRIEALAAAIDRSERGIERLEEGAAAAAEDHEDALARARALGEKYVRARLAAEVLSQEIEAYREKNQGRSSLGQRSCSLG